MFPARWLGSRGGSILVRHHHGYGGLWVVHVERATSGNQLDEFGGEVVVGHVERDRDTGASCTSLKQGLFLKHDRNEVLNEFVKISIAFLLPLPYLSLIKASATLIQQCGKFTIPSWADLFTIYFYSWRCCSSRAVARCGQ